MLKKHVFGSFNLNNSEKYRLSFEDIFWGTLDTYTKKINPPSTVLGGEVHGKASWLIAYKSDALLMKQYRSSNQVIFLGLISNCGHSKSYNLYIIRQIQMSHVIDLKVNAFKNNLVIYCTMFIFLFNIYTTHYF